MEVSWFGLRSIGLPFFRESADSCPLRESFGLQRGFQHSSKIIGKTFSLPDHVSQCHWTTQQQNGSDEPTLWLECTVIDRQPELRKWFESLRRSHASHMTMHAGSRLTS